MSTLFSLNCIVFGGGGYILWVYRIVVSPRKKAVGYGIEKKNCACETNRFFCDSCDGPWAYLWLKTRFRMDY